MQSVVKYGIVLENITASRVEFVATIVLQVLERTTAEQEIIIVNTTIFLLIVSACVCVEEGVKLSWECLPCMSFNKRVLTRSVAPGAIALLALGALLFVPGVILGFMWWCYLCAYVEQVKENNPFKKGSPKSTTSDQPAVEEAKSDDQPVSQ